MTRHDLLFQWEAIRLLQNSPDPPDRVRALGMADALCDVLGGKILLLDDGTALYEHDGDLILVEVFHDLP